MNRRFAGKGLRLIPVRCREHTALLYLYRPAYLKRDLAQTEARRLLMEMGYGSASPNRCVAALVRRFQTESAFPHEIGLFLGYPPEDVRGFIENRAQNYCCVGYLKVYGDAQKARQTF